MRYKASIAMQGKDSVTEEGLFNTAAELLHALEQYSEITLPETAKVFGYGFKTQGGEIRWKETLFKDMGRLPIKTPEDQVTPRLSYLFNIGGVKYLLTIVREN